jgi:hypothetical protein
MAPLMIPLDGRLTSQNILTGALNGAEVMYIVSPGNATGGNSYQISTLTLAGFFTAFPYLNSEVILAGATSGSPYMVETTDTTILFKKTLGAASYALCPLAASMAYGQEVLFKDIKGDAGTNNITVLFTSGEECDAQSQLEITTNYGWFKITPIPGGGGWYQSG